MISHEEMRKARSSNSELMQLEGEWYTQLQRMREHLSLQQERKDVPQKRCSKCRRLLDATLEFFYRCEHRSPKTGKYSLRSDCNDCRDHQEDARTWNKEYYQAHKQDVQPIHSDKHDNPEESRGSLPQKESRNLLPSVIVPELTPKKDAFTRTQWHELKRIYNYTCLCCGRKEPEIELVADHVIPQSRGGLTVIDNIQPLCRSCNARKHAKTIDYRVV